MVFVKTVALDEFSHRCMELVEALSRGETFTVTNNGREIATLNPSRADKLAEANGSAYDMISDLIGTVDGSEDLSSNKQYLADFGQSGKAD